MLNSPAEEMNSVTLKRNIEAQQNTMATNEAVISRLKEAIIAEKYTVGELIKQKEELILQIADLHSEKNTQANGLSVVNASLEIAKRDLSDIRTEIATLKAEQDAKNDLFAQKQEELIKRENNIVACEQQNSAKANELLEVESKLSDKHNLIKDLLERLS